MVERLSLLKKALWSCYAITCIIFTAIFLLGRFGSITGGELGYLIVSAIIILATIAITAFVLGIKSAHLSWVYPILVAVLATLIGPLVFWFPHHEVSLQSFLAGTWQVFFFYLITGFVSLGIGKGIGLLIRKKHEK